MSSYFNTERYFKVWYTIGSGGAQFEIIEAWDEMEAKKKLLSIHPNANQNSIRCLRCNKDGDVRDV